MRRNNFDEPEIDVKAERLPNPAAKTTKEPSALLDDDLDASLNGSGTLHRSVERSERKPEDLPVRKTAVNSQVNNSQKALNRSASN